MKRLNPFPGQVSSFLSANRTCKFPGIRLSLRGVNHGWSLHFGKGAGCFPEVVGSFLAPFVPFGIPSVRYPYTPIRDLIVTIQNGLGARENIARHLPTENVLLGIAEGFGASIKAAGHAYYTAMRQIRLGELDGGLSERLLKLRDIWRSAGFNANAFEDIQQLVWEKFLCNVALSAPCTVFGCGPAELRANPVWWDISLNCVREAYACCLAEWVNFSFDDPIAYVTDFASGVKNALPSMLQDHLARKCSEIDAINGMVPVVGARHGIDTPYNHTLSTIIRAHEAAFSKARS